MRVVELAAYGAPDVLRLADRPAPQPGPGEVRVRVRAAGVNPADHKWRSGMLDAIVPLGFPHVLGYDVAGEIDAVGEGVDATMVGRRVVAMLGHIGKGGYAEQALLPAADVVAIPETLDFATAAALPTPGLTGVQAAEDQIRPAPGETVLLTGAVGGVGRFALHALKLQGARVIAAVRSGQEATALAAGADDAFVLGEDCPVDALDHVLDTIGGDAVAALCRAVRPGGRIAYVGTTPIPPEGLPSEPVFVVVHNDPARLAALACDAASGAVAVPVARRLPLEQAAEAHRLVEAGGLGGKVVLEP